MATDGQEKEKEMLSGVFKCLIREIWQCPLADLDTVLLKNIKKSSSQVELVHNFRILLDAQIHSWASKLEF